jgi:hypothetical protein
MAGKLKALALAVLASAAIGGASASAASAGELHIKDMGKLTADGTQIKEAPTEFTYPEGLLRCPQAKYNFYTVYKLNAKGEQEDVETTASTLRLKLEEKETPLEPETLHCTFAGINGTTIQMNGCDYAFHFNTLQTTVTCPLGKQIIITVVLGGVTKCTIHIPTQGELGTVEVKNTETKQDIDLIFKLNGIHYTTTPGGIGLGKCTETLAGTNATFAGSVTVQATAGGVASNIWYE